MGLAINPIYTNVFSFKGEPNEKDMHWGFV